MTWTLIEKIDQGKGAQYVLQHERSYLLLSASADGHWELVPDDQNQSHGAVARIDNGPAGVKLEALGEDIVVLPAPSAPSSSLKGNQFGPYVLHKRNSEHSEVMLLRNNDQVQLCGSMNFLTLEWASPEVQVNSSATGEEEDLDSANNDALEEPFVQRVQEDADETEDEDLDNTITAVPVTQSMSRRSRSTPDASGARTEIVQETPTAHRIGLLPNAVVKDEPPVHIPESIESTPLPKEVPVTTPSALELFSTAPSGPLNGEPIEGLKKTFRDDMDRGKENAKVTELNVSLQHSPRSSSKATPMAISNPDGQLGPTAPKSLRKKVPQVRVAKPKSSSKRVSLANDEDEEVSLLPANKRVKTTDSEENLEGTIKPTTTRGSSPKSARKRTRGPAEASHPEVAPATTESPQSTAQDGLYVGKEPKVAFSNSTIGPDAHCLKSLRKHKGKKVESVGEDCDILCVRDGPLKKSMKLLLCVALGIPIVKDTWLLESAQADQLLDLALYKPNVHTQEQDWHFSLSRIWAQPQKNLFAGYTILCTPSLHKLYHPFKELEDVCRAVGATKAFCKPASKVTNKDKESTIILAADTDDDDARALMEKGFTCYSRDLLTLSILRGELDLGSDEFVISAVDSQPKKKGRPRKG